MSDKHKLAYRLVLPPGGRAGAYAVAISGQSQPREMRMASCDCAMGEHAQSD